MWCIALSPFYDLKEGVGRDAGDEFEVSEERFEEINEAAVKQGLTALVNETVKEPHSPAVKKATRTRSTAKKKAE